MGQFVGTEPEILATKPKMNRIKLEFPTTNPTLYVPVRLLIVDKGGMNWGGCILRNSTASYGES